MKAAGPLNLPSVRDEGPVSVRRDTNSPEAAGFMRAAQARASGGDAIARGVQAFAAALTRWRRTGTGRRRLRLITIM